MSRQEEGEFAAPRQVTVERESTARKVHVPHRSASPERPSVEPMWKLVRRLPRYARLTAALARDPRVPRSAKAMLAIGGLYLVSPIDLVPGIIPVAGQLDDLYVVLTGLQRAIRTSPDDVIDEHLAAVELERSCVDDDLATIRDFVRRGVIWSLYKSGQALARCSRHAIAFGQRVRKQGVTSNDQESI